MSGLFSQLMNVDIAHQIYRGAAPWAAVSLLLLGRNPHLSKTRITGSLLLAFFLLRIPFAGWSGFHWLAVLEPNPSATLTGLLSVALIQRAGNRQLFGPFDWQAAWYFGSAAALFLYPMGLGLTARDSYTWGWGAAIPFATALVATFLLLRGNRFGALLLLPLFTRLLGLQESTNFWNDLIDPFYGIISLAGVIWVTIRRSRQIVALTLL